MKQLIPKKLRPGDEVRVIAPSLSLSIFPKKIFRAADALFENVGLKVTYGKNAFKTGVMDSAPLKDRLSDLYDAFRDPKVKAIIAGIGGYNVNQLLSEIDYDLIRKNPKILCGMSDITALCNAITTKTGLITYSGPNYYSFGMKKGNEFGLESFLEALSQSAPKTLSYSRAWADEQWIKAGAPKKFYTNNQPYVVQKGAATGRVVGGNLCTLNLLHGTAWMPELRESILFIEDDDLVGNDFQGEFARNLLSLLEQPGAEEIRGVVFGRFQIKSKMSRKKLLEVVHTIPQLKNIPIIADWSFGHTIPTCTLPLGGTVRIAAQGIKPQIDLLIY